MSENPYAEIGDTEVVSAMVGTIAAALSGHTLTVVDAEQVELGSVLLGFLHDDETDAGGSRTGMEILRQSFTIGNVTDDELAAVGVLVLTQDPREGYDVIRVAATDKLIVQARA